MYMNACVYMYKMEIRFTKLKLLHDGTMYSDISYFILFCFFFFF